VEVEGRRGRKINGTISSDAMLEVVLAEEALALSVRAAGVEH